MSETNKETHNPMTLIPEKSEFEKQFAFRKDEFDFSNPVTFVNSLAAKTGLIEDEKATLTEILWMWEMGKPTTPPEVKAVERRKETVKEGHQLQVMSMNRNGVWDWFTIDTDLQDSALNEVLEKRLPYRIIPIHPFKAVDEGESNIRSGLTDLAENFIKNHPDYNREGFSEYFNGLFNGFVSGFPQGVQSERSKVVAEVEKEIEYLKITDDCHMNKEFDEYTVGILERLLTSIKNNK